MGDVRAAVLKLRTGKGMVLDPDDHDTWSAGSFFTNPVLDAAAAAELPAEAPRYPQADGTIKTSAAWLIEQAGYRRGFTAAEGQVSLSTKHTLALTNRGGATTSQLLDLARELRGGVEARFGISQQLMDVLTNTAVAFGWLPSPAVSDVDDETGAVTWAVELEDPES